MTSGARGFGGRRVVSFESRRAAEMASLIARHGGIPVSAPTVREVPVGVLDEARELARGLRAGELDVLVLMTGVGTRALVEAIASDLPRDELVALLASGRPAIVARGPKPAMVLKEIGVGSFLSVPPPNTWRETLSTLAQAELVSGKRVFVQEYGVPIPELYEALAARGATVTRGRVYRWMLPEDTGPLRAALGAIVAGEAEVALFTSRVQVEHALIVAQEQGIEDAFRRALGRGVIASIGPVCSHALRQEGLAVDLEPTHARMGHLVKEAAERADAILAAKRASSG